MIYWLLRITSTCLDLTPGDAVSTSTIRRATLGDARAIAEIYNHYIEHSTATFDTEPKTVGERIAWLTEHGDTYPVFVAERDGEVVAWGSVSPFRERPAYRHTVELGIYVAHEHTGEGLGPEMLSTLIAAARQIGHHVLVTQVVATNGPSVRMGERAGFETVGTMREVGYKFDQWLDVVIMQLNLQESGTVQGG